MYGESPKQQLRYASENISRHDFEERRWFTELAKDFEALEAERDKYKSALEWLRNQFCERSPGDKGQWRLCMNSQNCLTEYCASCYAAAMLDKT